MFLWNENCVRGKTSAKIEAMLRVFCEDWTGDESRVPVLSREEAHHLASVRRVRDGEPVEVLNGRGAVGRFAATVRGRRDVHLEIIEVKHVPAVPQQLQLLLGMPKPKVYASLLARATELGVGRITPLLTRHADSDFRKVADRAERWKAILVEAVKQSGNPWMPALDAPCELAKSMSHWDGAVGICAALQADAMAPSELFAQLRQLGSEGQELPQRLAIFIGPEGDFHADEYAFLRAAGVRFVGLGELVLRVETAATVLLGALRLQTF